MYIGTDLISKVGLEEKIDKLDFTFSINPKSIPFQGKYGIDINASSYTIADNASYNINNVIDNLNDSDLTINSIEVNNRIITADINYNDKILTISNTAYIS